MFLFANLQQMQQILRMNSIKRPNSIQQLQLNFFIGHFHNIEVDVIFRLIAKIKSAIQCSTLFQKMTHCVRHFVSILSWCVKGQFAIANLCCFKIFTNNQPIKVSDMYMKHALRKLRKNFTIAWLGLWTLQKGQNLYEVDFLIYGLQR